MYRELKQRGQSFRSDWAEESTDPSRIAFTVGSCRLLSSNTFPDSHFLHREELLPLKAVLGLLEQ